MAPGALHMVAHTTMQGLVIMYIALMVTETGRYTIMEPGKTIRQLLSSIINFRLISRVYNALTRNRAFILLIAVLIASILPYIPGREVAAAALAAAVFMEEAVSTVAAADVVSE